MDFNNTGAEVQEVAAPAAESVEMQEVAEPAQASQETVQSGKTDADAAFAALRRAREDAERKATEASRRAEEAERELAETKAANEARAAAFQRLGGENAEINALAESVGVEPSDILATLEAEQESAKKDLEIQRLQAEVDATKAEKEMQTALSQIQAIDPNVKSLYELGDSFIGYVKAGLSPENAYYAIKAKEINTKVVPPKEIGKINSEPVEKDFFTEAEVDAMTPEQQETFWKQIKKSMKKW